MRIWITACVVGWKGWPYNERGNQCNTGRKECWGREGGKGLHPFKGSSIRTSLYLDTDNKRERKNPVKRAIAAVLCPHSKCYKYCSDHADGQLVWKIPVGVLHRALGGRSDGWHILAIVRVGMHILTSSNSLLSEGGLVRIRKRWLNVQAACSQ